MNCEFSRTGRTCGEVIRSWHSKNICGPCLGWWRYGINDPNIAPISAAQAIRLFKVMANKPNEMTYAEYLELAQKALSWYSHGPEAWRPGQTYFNVLAQNRPDLSEQIPGTALDPFHHDNRIDVFLKWVYENW